MHDRAEIARFSLGYWSHVGGECVFKVEMENSCAVKFELQSLSPKIGVTNPIYGAAEPTIHRALAFQPALGQNQGINKAWHDCNRSAQLFW